jgi:protein-S-isoprenylcysteine O-methyltransferase Ste14
VSLAMPVLVGAFIFIPAGTINLPFVWAVLGVLAVFGTALAALADQGMMKERRSPGSGNQDRVSQPVAATLMMVHWILAGLDVGRFHWSPVLIWLQIAGLVGYVVAMVMLFWAMRTNPFYSSVVRVQADRGHRTVAAGPYRFVRHPGYAATLAGMILGGLALGSWIAMLPVLGFAIVFIRRTILEDRLLRRELDGYAEYAQQVNYRLIPGIL